MLATLGSHCAPTFHMYSILIRPEDGFLEMETRSYPWSFIIKLFELFNVRTVHY
jgi:hypothetical protein